MAVVARNLVPRPRFTEEDSTSPWGAYSGITPLLNNAGVFTGLISVAAKDDVNPIDGSNGLRGVADNRAAKGIATPLTGADLQPGDVLVVTMRYAMLTLNHTMSLSLTVDWDTHGRDTGLPGISPYSNWKEPEATDLVQEVESTVDGATSYATKTFRFTVPDARNHTFADEVNYVDTDVSIPADSELTWFLCLGMKADSGTSQNARYMALAGIRADVYRGDAYIDGYLDGSMTDADGLTYSWEDVPFESPTIVDDGTAVEEVIEPPEPSFSESPAEYTLPTVTGVTWEVDGEPTAAGTYSVDPTEDGTTVRVLAVAEDGYTFEPAAETVEHTWTKDPDPPTVGTVVSEIAERVCRSLDMDTDDEAQLDKTKLAAENVLLVAWGYTRGRGFSDDLDPVYPIQRVIEMSTARLVNNPELTERWVISSDSEKLTPFVGFTLAERYVLDRYRKKFA